MDRESRPVIFAVPGKGKECLREFTKLLKQQAGNIDNVAEIVCDMSPVFISAATEQFPNAAITVDWFHVVKLFTDAMDSVRRAEAKIETLPKGTRWAILKGNKARTVEQHAVLIELTARGRHTTTAFRVRELLRLSNARIEGMNGLFQAARARGYRNQNNFSAMIYLIDAPIAQTLWP